MSAQRKTRTVKRGYFSHPTALVEAKEIGEGTRIWAYAHVMKGAVIGRDCNIGDHCYVEGNVRIGNEVIIKNGVSLWDGVTLQDRVFVGPNVAFTNDSTPRAKVFRSEFDRTLVCEGASLGANVTLVSPLSIGRYALIGAGSVVTHDVPHFGLVYGNPARLVGFVCVCGKRLPLTPDKDGPARCTCGRSYQKSELEVRETGNATPTSRRTIQ